MLRIHNSLHGTKEEFRPIAAPRVGMYVCGVTVYDLCHVGHARCYVVFDVIRRWLRYHGYQVTYVRNITDIDDRIIHRAAQNKESIQSLSDRFVGEMHKDFAALAIEAPDHEPRATEHIAGIVSMIERLIASGFAYVSPDGDVLYAVGKFDGYGQLSGKRLEDLRAGARVEVDLTKRDPLDFVLWKAAKPGEPSWASPWGEGRPGWHIECSAMSHALLGAHFDLHGGGMDLKFPHHENEIAQSVPLCGDFVNLWVHNGFVNVDNEKMSKSLGNFFTIRDVLRHVRHPEVLRYFLLSSHYRGPINFSQVQLHQADAALTRMYTALRGVADGAGAEAAANDTLASAQTTFEAALDDDINTPEAFAVLQGLARELNSARAAGDVARAAALAAGMHRLADVLGVLQVPPEQWFRLAAEQSLDAREDASSAASLSETQIEQLIRARETARRARDFTVADQVRKQLADAGIVLEDQPGGGTSWKRA
jgi:cysteinyl-tRNA synthetase